MNEGPLVLSDVDCTLWCGCMRYTKKQWRGCAVNLEVVDLLTTMAESGWTVGLWSGGGIDHARRIRSIAGLTDVATIVSDKAPYPMQPGHVIKMFGRLPALTLDDDATEAVDGAAFLHVTDFNPHGWELRRA